jgi:iron complex transport system substrate-binding protein
MLSLYAPTIHAAITVQDDAGNTVTLAAPAKRIITLAPHATEMVFAAGAGGKIVGTSSYSDYPEAAKNIVRIGDDRQFDLERVIALKPDLLVVWLHGAFSSQLDALHKLGIPIYYSEPHKLNDIPASLIKMGKLTGTDAIAQSAAQQFSMGLQQLSRDNQGKKTLRVFYQVWGKPIYTLNNQHIVSDVIRLCGGVNVFGQLPVAAPTVSVEAVVEANPDVMLTGNVKDEADSSLAQWQAFPGMLAVKNHHLYSINPDQINRPGPRILDGARAVCAALQRARK